MFSAPADSSEGATSFDRISSDLKGAIGQVDSTAGDLAGALSGPAGDAASDALSYNFSGIEGAASASVDDGNSFASTGDTDAAGGQCVQKLAGIWGGSGSDAYQSTQQRWDSTSEAATSFDGISSELKSAIAQVDSTAAGLKLKNLSNKVGEAGALLNTISENINRSGTQSAADDAASSLSSSMGFTPPDDGFDFKAVEAGEAASDSLKYNFGAIETGSDGAKGGNVEFEWKVEEGESSGDVFDLTTETDGGGGGIPATLAEWAVLLA